MAKVKRRSGRRRAAAVSTAHESSRTPDVFGEDGDRGFMPEADLFQPDVRLLDAQRALAVQRGFMEALLGDPRIIDLFKRWFGQLVADHEALNTDYVLPLLRKELGLRWPWCAVAILEVFHRMVPQWITAMEAAAAAARARGASREESLEIRLDPLAALPREEAAVHAPPLLLEFETLEGEGTDEAASRLTALYSAAMAELAQAHKTASSGRAPKKGRAPKAQGEHLKRWGSWFYEARVARPARSINALAKANRVDRHQVRDAIADAETLLNLHAYTFSLGK